MLPGSHFDKKQKQAQQFSQYPKVLFSQKLN